MHCPILINFWYDERGGGTSQTCPAFTCLTLGFVWCHTILISPYDQCSILPPRNRKNVSLYIRSHLLKVKVTWSINEGIVLIDCNIVNVWTGGSKALDTFGNRPYHAPSILVMFLLYKITIMNAHNHFANRNQTIIFFLPRFGLHWYQWGKIKMAAPW